jgi:hypothetical protein
VCRPCVCTAACPGLRQARQLVRPLRPLGASLCSSAAAAAGRCLAWVSLAPLRLAAGQQRTRLPPERAEPDQLPLPARGG